MLCIQNMYSNSTTRIKLIKKVSAAINVQVGMNRDTLCRPSCFKYSLTTHQQNLTKNHLERQCLILMVTGKQEEKKIILHSHTKNILKYNKMFLS